MTKPVDTESATEFSDATARPITRGEYNRLMRLGLGAAIAAAYADALSRRRDHSLRHNDEPPTRAQWREMLRLSLRRAGGWLGLAGFPEQAAFEKMAEGALDVLADPDAN